MKGDHLVSTLKKVPDYLTILFKKAPFEFQQDAKEQLRFKQYLEALKEAGKQIKKANEFGGIHELHTAAMGHKKQGELFSHQTDRG